MAESKVAVTEGSGKNLHTFNRTIGANSVEDEVVLLGENYLASYVAVPAAGVSAATLDSHIFQIMAGASLKVRVRRIEMYQITLITAVNLVQFSLRRLSTAGTGGTAITPSLLDPADSASGATVMTLPSSKGTEGVSVGFVTAYMMQTLGASNQLVQPIVVWDFESPRSKPLIIAAGATNGIAVKTLNASAGAQVVFNVWFDESNF